MAFIGWKTLPLRVLVQIITGFPSQSTSMRRFVPSQWNSAALPAVRCYGVFRALLRQRTMQTAPM